VFDSQRLKGDEEVRRQIASRSVEPSEDHTCQSMPRRGKSPFFSRTNHSEMNEWSTAAGGLRLSRKTAWASCSSFLDQSVYHILKYLDQNIDRTTRDRKEIRNCTIRGISTTCVKLLKGKSRYTIFFQLFPNLEPFVPLLSVVMLFIILRQIPPISTIELSIWSRMISISKILQVRFQMHQFCLQVQQILEVQFAKPPKDCELASFTHQLCDLGVSFLSHGLLWFS